VKPEDDLLWFWQAAVRRQKEWLDAHGDTGNAAIISMRHRMLRMALNEVKKTLNQEGGETR